jgi:methylthioribose-1-phosphate isomerase
MRVDGKAMRAIWAARDGVVGILDQARLPHELVIVELTTAVEVAHAIRSMQVRGAPLIGAAAAYGVALAMRAAPSDVALDDSVGLLAATRPTAVNLRWALGRVRTALLALEPSARASFAWRLAAEMADEDVAINTAIGVHGLALIRQIGAARTTPVTREHPLQVLTHCNAGWLATVDVGTATAPLYAAFDAGLPLHVWVDETRPRNQGASLTAWELGRNGVPHTVIADNTGGHLMQHGRVDLCIVGSDRTTATGDVANKIGTYLKALAARDNGVPFYVALPSPTIDWSLADGVAEIPIEERGATEMTHVSGKLADGRVATVQVTPDGSGVANPGFDVTPARLVTGLITERGIAAASRAGLASLFPEHVAATERVHGAR